RPGAVAAERLRHRRDDADLAGSVDVPPALGNLAAVRRLDGLQRKFVRDSREDLVRRDDVVEPPAVRVPDVHVLDEAEDVAGPAEMPSEIDDAVVVEATLDHGVDLDGQPGFGRGSYPVE